RCRILPDLPDDRDAAVRACHCHGGHPDLPTRLELLPLAAHGGPEPEPAPSHGGHPILLPTQHLLGPDHGLRIDDHGPGDRAFRRVPAIFRQQHRRRRCEGLTMLELPDSWTWDFWLADTGAEYHLFFLRASRALLDPDRRHYRASVGHAVSTDLVNWDLLPDALVPSDSPAWDDLATWTGSVV